MLTLLKNLILGLRPVFELKGLVSIRIIPTRPCMVFLFVLKRKKHLKKLLIIEKTKEQHQY